MSLVALAAGLGAAAIRFPHPITIGLTAAVSSTAVGVAILRALGAAEGPAGRFAIAQLVVQDLIAIALLVVTTVPSDRLTPAEIAIPVAKAVAFVTVALLLGATLLHRVVRRIVAHAAPETMFVAFAALALIAAWLGEFAGLSFEFGAFVAGAVISEAAGSRTIETVVAPFRALFVTLFFVSIGMLLDPAALARQWLPILAVGLALVGFRAALWTGLARWARLPPAAALTVGIAMTALGEFNVVLVNEATAAGRLTGTEQQFLLGVTFLSMILSIAACPLFSRWAGGSVRPRPAP
jgi:CPA2 family monovalent cation:H+ antiporter-2